MNVIVIQTQVNCNYSNYYYNTIKFKCMSPSLVGCYITLKKQLQSHMMGVQQQICWVLYFIIRNMITVYFTSMGTQQRNSQLSFTKITIIVLAVFTLSEIIQATNLSVSTKAHVTKSRHLREYRSRIKVETWSHFCTLHFGPQIFTISSNRMVQQLFS